MILFENKVSPEFVSKIKSIAFRLGVDENWLMFIINYETGGTFSPSTTNSIGATGLIQFLPSTAIGLGTTTEQLRNMSDIDQLDYVYKYLNQYKGKMNSYYTTYQAVFFPVSLGQPDTYTFPAKDVSSNPSFFKHGDTMASFKKSLDEIVYQKVPTAYYDSFFNKKNSVVKVYQYEILIVAVVVILLAALWLVVRQILKAKK